MEPSRMIAIVTISRQMGSLGCEVARLVSELLGYQLVWRELINRAAIRAGTPETALAAIDELGLLGLKPSQKELQAYRQSVQEVIEELAGRGNVVIVGRAGQAILGDRPGVLHTRIIAPIDIRVHRVAARHNISLESAGAQVDASDHYRSRYLKRFYQVNWDDPQCYHLVINTGQIPSNTAAFLIAKAVQESAEPSKLPDQECPVDFLD